MNVNAGRAVKLPMSVGSPNLWELGNFRGSDLVSSSPPTCHQAVSRGSQLGVTYPGSGTAPRLVAADLEAPAAQGSLHTTAPRLALEKLGAVGALEGFSFQTQP